MIVWSSDVCSSDLPHPGVVVVRYDPPEGYSPADLRYVKRMQYDNRCFSSDLLLNAVEGLLRIRRDKHLLSDAWHLTSLGTPRGEAKEGRREVLAKLFADGPELELDNSNATTISEEHTSELQSLMRLSYAVFCLTKKNNHTHN